MGGACSNCTGTDGTQNELVLDDTNPQVMDGGGPDGFAKEKKQRLHLQSQHIERLPIKFQGG